MYGRFAEIYDAIYAFKDYKTESEAIKKLIRAKCPSAHTLLDVGCGTGAHLAFLAQDFDCVGLDFSEQQLERARTKLPNVTFVQGDMRNFDLGRKFDAVVCLFGTVGYSQDLEGLQQSMDHLAAHLSPGGVLLLEPWLTKDKFQSGRFDMITADAADMKIARSNTTRRDGDTSILDFHFLVVSAAGSEHFEESHRLGLFSDEDYRRCIDQAGLSAEHDEKGLMGRGLYTAWLRQ